MPPRPILSLLANDCGSYRHLTSATPSPFRCSIVPSLHGRDAGARNSIARPRATHPADGAGTAEGVPSRPRCSPAGGHVRPPRCGALARLLTPCGHRSAANPLPLSASLHACARACALALSEHDRALATTPSRPISPSACPYKKAPLPCTMASTAARLSAPVIRLPITPPICCHSPWTGPLTLSHSRCVGPGASLRFRATS
jgi:hypothetical protein